MSQAIDADQSLDAAVSRVIAFHLSQGREDVISSSTSAYSIMFRHGLRASELTALRNLSAIALDNNPKFGS